jgi:hypothetical protein
LNYKIIIAITTKYFKSNEKGKQYDRKDWGNETLCPSVSLASLKKTREKRKAVSYFAGRIFEGLSYFSF